MAVNTCYECDERYIGCHGECEKYKTALAEYRKAQDMNKHERSLNGIISGLHVNRRKKR